ncbi:hypothetical protein H920_19355 [Fukomys damarensis]|uniref:Uncharacterized protein n=1 Tax=Fukomys damarensis TaxID=885580 RepID=A0A091CMV2_FUKDA|nr:hypothetical protein H920_19355 [Fukomys damarensis]
MVLWRRPEGQQSGEVTLVHRGTAAHRRGSLKTGGGEVLEGGGTVGLSWWSPAAAGLDASASGGEDLWRPFFKWKLIYIVLKIPLQCLGKERSLCSCRTVCCFEAQLLQHSKVGLRVTGAMVAVVLEWASRVVGNVETFSDGASLQLPVGDSHNNAGRSPVGLREPLWSRVLNRP